MIEEHEMVGIVVRYERRRNSSRFEVFAPAPWRRRIWRPWQRLECVGAGRIRFEGSEVALLLLPGSIELSENLRRCITLRWKTMQRNIMHEEIERLENRRRQQ